MQSVESALNDVKELYEKFTGAPAPEIPPTSYVSFPPGVDPVHHAIEEVERLRQLTRQVAAAPSHAAWTPLADVYVTSEGMVLFVEIPGVVKDDLKIFTVGGELVVRGERKHKPSAGTIRSLAIERGWGPFERRFALPAGAQPDRLKARYREGILEIRIAGEGDGIPGEMTIEVE
jgi:HSP20 family protein